jgi:ubiquinone/menaquinone biosynthesis C-methylase UbiE
MGRWNLFATRLTFIAICMAVSLMNVCCIAQEKASGEPQATTTQEPAVPASINKDFLDPNLSVEDFIKRFEVESREVFANRVEIAKALELKPGMAVADIGSGTGAYLSTLTDLVGKQGRVYAVDVSPVFTKFLRKRVAQDGLDQVEVVLSDADSTGLSPNSVDAVFVCDTYHHFEKPIATVQSIRQALKPNGLLVVVDFDRVPGKSREWVLQHVRAGKEDFRAEIEKAGLMFVDEVKIDELKETFILRFRKP